MRTELAQERHDRFLTGVTTGAFTTIFFIVGAGVVTASWGGGIAAAAGSLAVAYVAKLVVEARNPGS